MTPQERINADAKSLADNLKVNCTGDVIYKVGYEEGYIVGATAENSRAQGLVDALEWIQMHAPIEPIVDDVISGAIEKWKSGKEVGDETA